MKTRMMNGGQLSKPTVNLKASIKQNSDYPRLIDEYDVAQRVVRCKNLEGKVKGAF